MFVYLLVLDSNTQTLAFPNFEHLKLKPKITCQTQTSNLSWNMKNSWFRDVWNNGRKKLLVAKQFWVCAYKLEKNYNVSLSFYGKF